MPKLVRITTVPMSLQLLLKGQMRFMNEQGFDVTMISSDGKEIPDLLVQEGCPHIIVPFTRSITPWQDLICLIKLTKFLKKIKPDIVHTHTPKAGLIGMWAAWFAGVPVRFHTIAGLPWMESVGAKRKLLMVIEKMTAFPAHQIFPNSFALKKFLEENNIARNKMKVLGNGSSNGIDCNRFSKSESIQQQAQQLLLQENLSNENWIWVFVGRVVKDKGMSELLAAYQKIKQQFPDDRLWLLGDEEPELDPLTETDREILRTDNSIKCWGFIKDIRPYLAASKVLVFPSYREGFPNVPMQAGAMGCALILSNINGCNEIVDDGENGVLVTPKSTDELYNAMLKLRQNEDLQKTYANKILQKIRDKYSTENLWKIILSEYKIWLNKN